MRETVTLLTIREVAARLRCSTRKVMRLPLPWQALHHVEGRGLVFQVLHPLLELVHSPSQRARIVGVHVRRQ